MSNKQQKNQILFNGVNFSIWAPSCENALRKERLIKVIKNAPKTFLQVLQDSTEVSSQTPELLQTGEAQTTSSTMPTYASLPPEQLRLLMQARISTAEKKLDKDIDDREQALGVIFDLMTPEMKYLHNSHTDPFELWTALRAKYGKERIDKKYLMERFHGLTFPPGSTIGGYIAKIKMTIDQLVEADAIVDDSAKTCVLLKGLPTTFEIPKQLIRSDPRITFEGACDKLLMAEMDLLHDDKYNTQANGSSVAHIASNMQIVRKRVAPNYQCNKCGGRGHHSSDCATPTLKSGKEENKYEREQNARGRRGGRGRGGYNGRQNERGRGGKFRGRGRGQRENGQNRNGSNGNQLPQLAKSFDKEKTNLEPINSTAETSWVRMDNDFDGNMSVCAIIEQVEEEDDDVVLTSETFSTKIDLKHDKYKKITDWIIDSGATHHVVTYPGYFTKFHPRPAMLTLPDQRRLKISGIGDINLLSNVNGNPVQISLKDVLYCPEFHTNLLSSVQFHKNGYRLSHSGDKYCFLDGDNAPIIVGSSNEYKTLFITELHPLDPQLNPQINVTSQEKQYQNDRRPIWQADRRLAYQPHPTDALAYKWHCRLGHLNFRALNGMGIRPPLDPQQCRSCHLTKGIQFKHLPIRRQQTSHPLQLVHSDVCTTAEPDLFGNKYFVTFTDDFTRFSYVYLMRAKSEVFSRFEEYKAHVENNPHQYRIEEMRFDNGGEFVNRNFQKYAIENGITLSPTAPYSPESNGVSERLNRTLLEKTRAMLCWAQLPNIFWGLALQAANYLKNRSNSRPVGDSPFLRWFGSNPELSHLRIWGCLVTTLIPRQRRDTKLDNTGYEAIFVGYTGSSTMYRVYTPETKTFTITRDLKFHEDKPSGVMFDFEQSLQLMDFCLPPLPIIIPRLGPERRDLPCRKVTIDGRSKTTTPRLSSKNQRSGRKRPLAITDGIKSPSDPPRKRQSTGSKFTYPHHSRVKVVLAFASSIHDSTALSLKSSSSTGLEGVQPSGSSQAPRSLTSGQRQQVTEQRLDTLEPLRETPSLMSNESAAHPDRPTRRVHIHPSRSRPYLSRFGRLSKPAVRYDPSIMAMSLNQTSIVDYDDFFAYANCSVRDALSGGEAHKWREAMEQEYNGLIRLDSWDIVPRPANVKVIPCHWILTRKRNQAGEVVRHKARLVAQGNYQTPGIDFDQTYAPVANQQVFRTLLALAAYKNYKLFHLDVDNAFLNGEIDMPIYLRQPPFFQVPQKTNWVCRMKKALYGLRQSARCWWLEVDKTFENLGFQRCKHLLGIYVNTIQGFKAFILLYVDDILIACRNQEAYNEIRDGIARRYKIKELGEATSFLNIKVERLPGSGGIILKQQSYIAKLVREGSLRPTERKYTPMKPKAFIPLNDPDERYPYIPAEDQDPRYITRYRSVVGATSYLALATRPEIAFTVNSLSRFCSSPQEHHWAYASYLLRYLNRSQNRGLVIDPQDEIIRIYADADFAGDIDSRKSTSGVLVTFGGAPITWASKKQTVIALSTAEAEYIALAEAIKQGRYIYRIFLALGFVLPTPILYCDSSAAIAISNQQIDTQRARSIDVRYHFIRESIQKGEFILQYVRTDENQADILTKSLNTEKFKYITDNWLTPDAEVEDPGDFEAG